MYTQLAIFAILKLGIHRTNLIWDYSTNTKQYFKKNKAFQNNLVVSKY